MASGFDVEVNCTTNNDSKSLAKDKDGKQDSEKMEPFCVPVAKPSLKRHGALLKTYNMAQLDVQRVLRQMKCMFKRRRTLQISLAAFRFYFFMDLASTYRVSQKFVTHFKKIIEKQRNGTKKKCFLQKPFELPKFCFHILFSTCPLYSLIIQILTLCVFTILSTWMAHSSKKNYKLKHDASNSIFLMHQVENAIQAS